MKQLCCIGMLVLGLLFSCQTKQDAGNALLFSKPNLVAWCIVPFDSVERTPEQRATMLNELGIGKLAYDWRAKHLPTFADEIKALKSHHIALQSVWLWIEPDSTRILDDTNEQIFEVIRKNNVKTDFWLGFSSGYFEGLTEEQKLEKATTAVLYIEKRAREIGCGISLYNHGDWFGEPVNQIRIIEKTGSKDIGMVYNFHHAHAQIKDFPALLPKMLPYLKAVNINGMKVEGPKILPLGQGDQELDMLKALKASGYNGPIGILGHVEAADVKVILEGNLKGLAGLLEKMGDTEALATY